MLWSVFTQARQLSTSVWSEIWYQWSSWAGLLWHYPPLESRSFSEVQLPNSQFERIRRWKAKSIIKVNYQYVWLISILINLQTSQPKSGHQTRVSGYCLVVERGGGGLWGEPGGFMSRHAQTLFSKQTEKKITAFKDRSENKQSRFYSTREAA